MNFLTLADIKQQLRIDHDDEDTLLTAYGEAAEETVLNICNTTYAAMLEKYTAIPKSVILAAMMLVDTWYQHRSPVGTQAMHLVPYTFEVLIKPYMIFTYPKEEEEEEEG